MNIKKPTKFPSYYQIGIIFPDGKKIIKQKCSLNEVFETYFLNLDSLKGNLSSEELLEKYKQTYSEKGIKVGINFIDSWGHKWVGKVAWPRDSKFIEYLNNRV